MGVIAFAAKKPAVPPPPGIDQYTVLMMHLDGDQSDSQHIVTANGNPQFSTAQSKFGGSSMLFDGSGDYLSIPDSDDWDFGSGDFTIDFWLYYVTVPTVTQEFFFNQRVNSDNAHEFSLNSGSLKWAAYSGATLFEFNRVVSLSNGTWHHIAAVRNGNVLRMYLDGQQLGADFSYAGSFPNWGAGLDIGRWSGGGLYLNAFMDELRISKGIARWTSDFSGSLPSAPYTPDANTKLLLHFDGDISTTPHTLTVNGNPQLSATTAKFNGAMYFDGSGDYLSIPDSDDWDFGSGDFTIDWWEYRTSGADYKTAISRDTTGIYSPFLLGFNYSPNSIVYMTSNGSEWDIASLKTLGALTLNTWNHFAVVRNGTTFYCFKNGVQTDTWTSALSLLPSSQPLAIGSSQSGNWYAGYIDELRISKGIARWTANFTPENGPYTE